MITKMATKGLGSIHSVDMLEKWMIHFLGGMEPDGMRFHHAMMKKLVVKI